VLRSESRDHGQQHRDAAVGRRGRVEFAALDGGRHGGTHQGGAPHARSIGGPGGDEAGNHAGEQQLGEGGLLGGEAQRLPARGADRRPARRAAVHGGGDHGGMGLHAALEQGVIYGGARVEVLVERGLAQADPPRHLGQVERGDAQLGHHGDCRVENLLARLQPVPLARRHRLRGHSLSRHCLHGHSHRLSVDSPIAYCFYDPL
jgi:hypothetical protein